MQITNIQKGARGLNTTTGAVLIGPGESVAGIELNEAELAIAKATGWFEFDSKPVKKKD
ncbi:hypothetical protein AEAC466_13435 [Asticcacaulis sp. AC466]|uniref:hypothetical protein n=1 Tax=Asticcacaulis sp. AC466 TaxID=1282362 RepID=UPI0003C3DDC1|nr:hypothetical protein [Asticcacaulis sp. AC466]ESQ83249.1 hypothetical protein AEAC466_13435 [Asticcacaulis sp. AC466]